MSHEAHSPENALKLGNELQSRFRVEKALEQLNADIDTAIMHATANIVSARCPEPINPGIEWLLEARKSALAEVNNALYNKFNK